VELMTVHHTIKPYPQEKPMEWKTGVRVLGVAESFEREDSRSIVVGIIMRGDRHIDGTGFCLPHVGGMDSTDELISMYKRINRKDIRAWMLGGSAISWFNIVDIEMLSEATQVPVVCVTYHDSNGIEKYLKEYFPDTWQSRYDKLSASGERKEVHLNNGHCVFLTTCGMNLRSGIQLTNLFTDEGKIPEPIRVARITAASLRRDMGSILFS
jgi:endonuclease V-like protein UPF0215 family